MLAAESPDALVDELWINQLQATLMKGESGGRANLELFLRKLEEGHDGQVLSGSLDSALLQIEASQGSDEAQWQWGRMHLLMLSHPIADAGFDLSPVPRPGDANTVNATRGVGFAQTAGASWREIIDVGNWDRSVITNVPAESGDPASVHYSDLLENWAAGRYHPLPYSRKAVEAATEERMQLVPMR